MPTGPLTESQITDFDRDGYLFVPGLLDPDETRLLLTLDRDFGDLIFHHAHPAPAGVILFRLSGSDPHEDNRRMNQTLEQPEQWVGRFTTVTDTLIRSRAFPR